MLTRRTLLLSVVAASIAACSPFGLGSYQTVRVSEREAKSAINAQRARNGAGPVEPSRALQVIAAQQARLMAQADRLAHEAKSGYGLNDRIRRAGYQGTAGENVSAGYTSLDGVIDGWMASPGHRHNLLNPDFTEFGIAAARVADGRESRYGVYWAIVLGAPRTAPTVGPV